MSPGEHPAGGRRPLVDPVDAQLSRDVTDALLVAAGQGDRAAFAAFYDVTVPVVFGLLRGVLGEAEDADRATEEVYLQMWARAPGFDPTARSARATVLFFARRALVGRVHELCTSPDTASRR